MKREEDLDLRREFARLRNEGSTAVPSFARTLDAARQRAAERSRPRRWAWAAAAPLAAAAAFALWITPSQETRQSTTAPTEVALGSVLESWETPTDYLLDTPGTDLLDSTLEIGETDLYEIELPTEPEPRTDSSQTVRRRYA